MTREDKLDALGRQHGKVMRRQLEEDTVDRGEELLDLLAGGTDELGMPLKSDVLGPVTNDAIKAAEVEVSDEMETLYEAGNPLEGDQVLMDAIYERVSTALKNEPTSQYYQSPQSHPSS